MYQQQQYGAGRGGGYGGRGGRGRGGKNEDYHPLLFLVFLFVLKLYVWVNAKVTDAARFSGNGY